LIVRTWIHLRGACRLICSTSSTPVYDVSLGSAK